MPEPTYDALVPSSKQSRSTGIRTAKSIGMAETATGIVGLLTLFSTVMDCFEYVRIAKTFERDFATAQIKLDCAGWRLSRWAATVGIRNASTVSVLDERYARAEEILSHIEQLWNQAKRKSEICRRPGVEVYEVRDMEPVQAMVHERVRDEMRKRVVRRQGVSVEPEKASTVKKAKWALYKKQELNELINNITELVSRLECVLPPGSGMVRVEELDVEEVPEPARQTLHAIAEKEVAEVQEAVQKELVHTDWAQSAITPLQVAETLRQGAQGQDPYLEEVVKKIIRKLQPSTRAAGDTYNINLTMQSMMHSMNSNSYSIGTAFFHSTQNNYTSGADRDL